LVATSGAGCQNEARFVERALVFLAKEINIGKKTRKNAEK
jgi:hypothetical protein